MPEAAANQLHDAKTIAGVHHKINEAVFHCSLIYAKSNAPKKGVPVHHLHEYIECLNKVKPKMLLIKAEMHVPANLQNHKFSNVLFFFILFK